MHNRLLKDKTAYVVNSLNQLEAQGEATYKYDANGNLIEKREGQQRVEYRYDAFDRLIEVLAGSDVTRYTYDAFNRRLTKTVKGVTKKYFYEGQNEIGCFVGSELRELRLLGLGKGTEIGAAVALELGKTLYIPLHDHNGNVVALINKEGQVAESYRYSAFGERIIFNANGVEVAASSVKNPWCFASKRYDEETGFVYFGRRYYAPEIGRWLTPDPIGYADGPNLYAYLQNNPLNAVDLYGLERESRNALDGPRHERVKKSQEGKNTQNEVSRNREDRNERSTWRDFGRALGGIVHGGIDFVVRSLQDVSTMASRVGVEDMDCSEMRDVFNAEDIWT